MSIDIGAAVEDGFERTTTSSGLVFVAIFAVVNVAALVFVADLMAMLVEAVIDETSLEPGDFAGGGGEPLIGDDPTEPIVGLSALAAVVGLIGTLIVQLFVTVGAVRTFENDDDAIRGEYFTRRLPWVAVNLIVGGIVFGFALSIGFALFFFPGVFLLLVLYFWWIVVIVEDRNFVEAFEASWGLTDGNRVELFLLGLIVVISTGIINNIGSYVASVLPRWPGIVVSAAISAVVAVFSVATAVYAYRQLRDDAATTPGDPETPADRETTDVSY